MKKLLFILLLLASRWCVAQNHQYIEDTAARIVDSYLRLLNYEAVRQDSILHIESIIVQREFPEDTILMLRWMRGNQCRIEVWAGDTMQVGLIFDGKESQKYFPLTHQWAPYFVGDYYDEAIPYDYRGSLYNWRTNGLSLKYMGEYTFEGHPVERVFASGPFVYDRYYLFEKESGLLFLYTETDTMAGVKRQDLSNHVDWRAYHEYMPVGESLFPTVMSYQTQGSIVIIRNFVYYLPPKDMIFKRGDL